MKYAITNNGASARMVSDNYAAVDGEFLWAAELPGLPFDPDHSGLVIDGDTVRPLDQTEIMAAKAAAERASIPAVSPRQIRQALTIASLRASVEAAIAMSDQDTKDWWEFATEFERNHPKVVAMVAALGVPEAEADALWALAYSL